MIVADDSGSFATIVTASSRSATSPDAVLNMALLNEVKTFVAEYWYEPKGGLSAETSVNCDLGMDGDDGIEFMQAFSERFGVDLTAFPCDDYFGPEASANPISIIIGTIRWWVTGRSSTLSPLPLRRLTEVVENRSWV